MNQVALSNARPMDYKKLNALLDESIALWLNGMPQNINESDTKKWVNGFLSNKQSRLFTLLVNKRIIGAIWMENINKNRGCEIGFFIGKKYQGKGYGVASLYALFELASHKFKLKKVRALTTNFNVSSIASLEKVGFVLKKRMKKDYFDKKLGKWCDVLLYERLLE